MAPNPHPIKIFRPEPQYHAKDALGSAVQGGMVGGAAGFVTSAVQNTMANTRVGAMGVFTRTGSTVATMTIVPALYMFAKDASANWREKDDVMNCSIAGFLAGSSLGLRCTSAAFTTLLAEFWDISLMSI
jgi:hypothetical protein